MRKDILKTKLEKLEKIKKAGMEAYPEKSQRDFGNGEALERFTELASKEITLVGRVKSFRPMGGSAFAHIEDGSGKIRPVLEQEKFVRRQL